MNCPQPEEFNSLVDHAEKRGLGPKAMLEALRAYMIHNQNLMPGQDATMPTPEDFDQIMDLNNTFIDNPARTVRPEPPVGSKDYYTDLENAFPWYKVVKDNIPFDETLNSNLRGRAVVSALAEKLSNNLGVPYQYITAEQARELTKDINTWSGQPAFFLGDTIYILPELANAKSVMHEFAHPLVRAIYLSNRALFDNLVKQVMATSKGSMLLGKAKETYPTVAEDDPIILEEVLVMALTESATDRSDSAFNKFISNLLYAIKQLLRRVFGKAKVEKLDATTTLDELADMLVMEEFALDTQPLTRNDIAAFNTEYEKQLEGISELTKSDLQQSTDELFDMISSHIQLIKNNKDYTAMDAVLRDLYQRQDLKEIYESLAKYTSKNAYLIDEMTRLQSDAEFAKQQTKAFLDSMLRLREMVKRMHSKLIELSKDLDQKDNVAQVFYFNNILNSWDNFLNNFETVVNSEIEQGNAKLDNPLVTLAGGIRRQISNAQKTSDKIYSSGVGEVIKQTLAPMRTAIDEKYESMMANLRKNNAPQSVIELRQKDYWGLSGKELTDFLDLRERVIKGDSLTSLEKDRYDKLKMVSYRDGAYLTDEKIDYLLTGKLGDAHALNSFLEGFMYNQDPVVFGFATWVKNNLTDVFTTAQAKGNEFITEVKPLLEAAGYSQSNPAAFGRRATFKDKKGGKDKAGSFEVKEVHSILNPWKDYRADLNQMDEEIRIATEKAYESGDNTELNALKRKQEEYKRKYFHTPYTEEYYKRFEIFRKGDNDTVGAKAEGLRNEILSKIQNLTTSIGISTTNERSETRDDLEVLWREYRQLHSNYNSAGQLKSKEDIAVAERLREFRDATRDVYEYDLIPGLFENALSSYEDNLAEQGYEKWSEPFKKLRAQWILKNTKVKIKSSYYDEQKRLTDEIKTILSKLPKDARTEVDLSKYYEDMLQLMNPYRDEDSQPDGTAMSVDNIQEIKRKQQLISLAKENLPKVTGLTKLEQLWLNDYFERLRNKEQLTQEDRTTARELLDRKSKYGLSKADKTRLYELFSELGELQKSEATEYYIDVVNNLLSLVDQDVLVSNFGFKDIDVNNADILLTEDFYKLVIAPDPELKDWFDKNHVMTSAVDKEGEPYIKIERVKAWSIVRPRSAYYYEIFTFNNSRGEEESILGLPSNLYYEKNVKPEYITKVITPLEALEQGDLTKANVDNKGKFLPRLDNPDKKYVNEQYFQVRDTDKSLYNAITALSKWHLKFQENNPNSSKLGFDVPRYRKPGYESRFEYFTAEGKVENPISRYWRRVRSFFGAAPDDADKGYNFQEQSMLMDSEVYDDESSGIPVSGLSALEPDDVSLDLTFGMLRYMISSEKQRKLIEMNPMARALQTIVSDPDNGRKQIKELSKSMQKNNNMFHLLAERTKFGKPRNRTVRETAINNFIEREFEGITQKGVIGADNDNVWMTKLANNIMRMSAFGYFALDIPSALKNSFSARIQSLQEAAGGRYFNMASYGKGVAWSNKVMGEVSFEIYKFGPKSHDQQLAEVFDAIQGRFEEKFGEVGSRSLTKDALGGLTWLTSFRKWTELNSGLSIFGAMMHHQKVDQTVNGETRKISYIDAWETVDGQIKLKDGVDNSWGIGGSNFKAFKNKVQGVNNNLNGAFSKFEYAEADRYMAFKWAIFMKRWFVRMFLNRYQFRGSIKDPKYRYDAAVGDTVMGFHVEAVRAAFRGIASRGEYLQHLSPSEKVAMLKTMMDMVYLMMFSLALSMVFGFDMDDEDKFQKIRDRSGPLPFPFLGENERDFNLGGWLTNHALYMTLQLKNETLQWLPVTSMGFDNYVEMIKMDSFAMKNTFDNYRKMSGALILMGSHAIFDTDDSRAYWDQREGPYTWLQEDGAKWQAYILRSMGVTGKSVDPAQALTNWVKSQNWR